MLHLSGCSVPPIETSSSDSDAAWQLRQHQLDGIEYWYLTGRVAVNNGSEAWHLDMNWSQKGEAFLVELSGPFGAGKVRLAGNADGVVLTDSENQHYFADSAERLLYDRTGLVVPVDGLRYWIIGLTGPTQTQQPRLDTQGRLAYLENADWAVNFRGYTQVNGLELPRKIFIARPEREIDVRLIVDKWTLGVH